MGVDCWLYEGGATYEDTRSRMEVFWIPLLLVQTAHLVSSQPQSLNKELPVSSTEFQPCGTSSRCGTLFQSSTELSLRGFCGHQFFAWRRTAHPKEKGGAVTARRLLHPFHKGLASSTDHAEELQEIPMANAPVVGNKSTHLPAFSRPSVRTRLMAKMELEVSAETEAGVGATASQLIKMRYRFV